MAVTINYGIGTGGANYDPNVYAELGNMIGKIAHTIIRGIETRDPLGAAFDKIPVDNGDTIEASVVKLIESSAYDATGANWWTRDTSDKLAVQYFKDWTRQTYKATIDSSMIRKVLTSRDYDSEVADLIVGSLGKSRIRDKYYAYRGLFDWGATSGSGEGGTGTAFVQAGTVSLANGATDYKGILKAIKDTVSGMTYVNDDFNSAGLERSTSLDDIIVLMPYKIKNAIDVDELTGFFNLDKGEIKQRIITTDSTQKNIYVVDKNAILGYTRLYQMVNDLNPSGLFWNYFLHVEDLYAICTLFDGAYITYETPA